MKHIYTALIFTILLVSCKDKPMVDRSKTDWEFYKLKGDVKAVSEKTEITGGANDKTARETEYDTDYAFNEQGILVSEKKYLPGNKLFQEISYKGRGKMIKQVQYVNNAPSVTTDYAWDKAFTGNTSVTRRNADNTQLDRVGMKYNAAGKVTERVVYNRQDIPIEKTTYEYDDKGNLKVENFYLDQDAIQVTNLYEYTGPNKTAEVKVKPDGSLIYKTFYEYNSSNKLVRSGTNNSAGKTQYGTEVTYDSRGNVVTNTVTEVADNLKTTDKYTYDANNNKTTWTSYNNDVPGFEVNYKYDKHNNVTYIKVAELAAGAQPVTKTYTYTYDKNGNWVTKKTAVNSAPAFTATRTITYY